MEAATVATITKGILTAATDKRVWTGIASIVAMMLLPFIFLVVCIASFGRSGASHNRQAVDMAFHNTGNGSLPAEYRQHIRDMQDCFAEIEEVLAGINEMAEGEPLDGYLVKAVFYALFFGSDSLQPEDGFCQQFADCFVHYESRSRTVVDEYGEEWEEEYQVSIAIGDMVKIFGNLQEQCKITVTYENQANAMNVYSIAKYGTAASTEGDVFGTWDNWIPAVSQEYYDLPASEVGGKVLELAMSRLGDPYSQEYRGQGDYVDCSYLTMWCYGKAGILLPGTAAEQARYCVDNKLTISRENLQPGDLVFWSHKPNGRYLNITHVGIYAGDGMVVDASSSRGMVVHRGLFDAGKQVLYGRPSGP